MYDFARFKNVICILYSDREQEVDRESGYYDVCRLILYVAKVVMSTRFNF